MWWKVEWRWGSSGRSGCGGKWSADCGRLSRSNSGTTRRSESLLAVPGFESTHTRERWGCLKAHHGKEVAFAPNVADVSLPDAKGGVCLVS